MNTPQTANHKAEIVSLTAILKAKSALQADESAALPDLFAQIQRFLPPVKPSFNTGGRTRQFTREQQDGV